MCARIFYATDLLFSTKEENNETVKGHEGRMDGSYIPKQVLYSELVQKVTWSTKTEKQGYMQVTKVRFFSQSQCLGRPCEKLSHMESTAT